MGSEGRGGRGGGAGGYKTERGGGRQDFPLQREGGGRSQKVSPTLRIAYCNEHLI